MSVHSNIFLLLIDFTCNFSHVLRLTSTHVLRTRLIIHVQFLHWLMSNWISHWLVRLWWLYASGCACPCILMWLHNPQFLVVGKLSCESQVCLKITRHMRSCSRYCEWSQIRQGVVCKSTNLYYILYLLVDKQYTIHNYCITTHNTHHSIIRLSIRLTRRGTT